MEPSMTNVSSSHPPDPTPNDPARPVDPVGQGRVGVLGFQPGNAGTPSGAARSSLGRASPKTLSLPFGDVKLCMKPGKAGDDHKPRFALALQMPMPPSAIPASIARPNQAEIDDAEHGVYLSEAAAQGKMRKERNLANRHLQGQEILSTPKLHSSEDPRSTDGQVRLIADRRTVPLDVQAYWGRSRGAYETRLDVPYCTMSSGAGVANKMNVRMLDGQFEAPLSDILVDGFDLSIDGQKQKVHLHAMFNGHGGRRCLDHAKNAYSSVLRKNLERFCQGKLSDRAVVNALNITSVEASRSLAPETTGGATANVIVTIGDKAWISTLGDVGAILVRPDRTEQLSDPDTVGPRALGDHDIPGVSARPKVFSIALSDMQDGGGKHCYLVQFTDGVRKTMSESTIALRVRYRDSKGYTPALIAEQLVEEAAYRGTRDDAMVMVIPVSALVTRQAATPAS
ncbi:hypothetical protein CEY04_26100 [Achromobacter sp. HZ28]|nr:hypothetical protein CEY05_27265 [Achromobacter sp. HZ34]OWT71872.1 hypothetical protein CEY04_26100 [Achromobacter sp. HZ28]